MLSIRLLPFLVVNHIRISAFCFRDEEVGCDGTYTSSAIFRHSLNSNVGQNERLGREGERDAAYQPKYTQRIAKAHSAIPTQHYRKGN